MRIGMVGLGKMGGNMAERLLAGGDLSMFVDRDAASFLAPEPGPDAESGEEASS